MASELKEPHVLMLAPGTTNSHLKALKFIVSVMAKCKTLWMEG